MRSALVFIALVAFVAVAFVPPTQESLHANAAFISSLHDKAEGASVSVKAVSDVAYDFVNALGIKFGTNATAAVEYAKNLQSTVKKAQSGDARAILSLAKDQTAVAVQTAVTARLKKLVAGKPIAPGVLSAEEKLLYKEQLRLIEQAVQESDVRVCAQLRPAKSAPEKAPSAGDFMALCVARVTGSASRCLQIDATVSVPLKRLCEQSLGLPA